MQSQTQIPETYLENINVINSSIQYNDFLLNQSNINAPSNLTQNKFSMTYNKTNDFFKTENNFPIYIPSSSQKNFFNYQQSFKNNIFEKNNFRDFNTLNKLNSEKKFFWKEIMNNNFFNRENELQNPLIQNLLNSNLNENEIQNIPENYLINLIQTLQGIVTQGIEDTNNLENENQKLNKHLFEIKNNCDNMAKNNEKINESLNLLKIQNNNQIEIIKSYEKKQKLLEKNNLNENNLSKYLALKGHKKKFYCKLCSNKVFRSQYYLDSHIKRRHNNYYKDNLSKKENKTLNNKINNNIKKLKELKNYFDILLKSNIKKVQYARLNERINNIENLLYMSKAQDNILNNFIVNNGFERYDSNDNNDNNDYNDNNDNYDIDNNDNNDIDDDNNDDNNDYNNENTIEYNNDDNIDYSKDNNIIKEDYSEKLRTINENKINENIKFEELKMDTMEKIRENNFQNIKRYFEKGDIRKNEFNGLTQEGRRRKEKTKTTKQKNINALTLNYKDELNQSADEIKSEDILKGPNKSKKIDKIKKAKQIDNNKNDIKANDNIINFDKNMNDKKEDIQNKVDKNNIISNINNKDNINQNINIEKVSESKKSSNYSNQNIKKEEKISFSEYENISNKDENALKTFYDKFTNRDQYFSEGKKDYYEKSIIPKDYKFDEKKIEKIIEEKINNKLINIDQTSNEKLLQDIRKLNYQMIDQDFIYGRVHCFYSRNISQLMKTKQLIEELNRYYNFNENKETKSEEDINSQDSQNSGFKSFGEI